MMLKKKPYVYIPVFVILLIFLIWVIAGKNPEDGPILTAKVVNKSFLVLVEAVGELDAARSTVLFSEVSGDRGKIVFIIDDGTKVKPGDVIVRLDPTLFEEEVTRLTAKVQEYEAEVSAKEQLLEGAKVQAEREVKTAEFDLRAAKLDLVKLVNGDGPLELSRFQKAAEKAKREWEDKKGYLKDLEELEAKGYIDLTEIAQALNNATEAKTAYEIAQRQYESYRDYVLPSSKEKAQAKVARARMDLAQLKKGGNFKVGNVNAALRKARQDLESTIAALKTAKKELEHTVIQAPIPGIVVLPESYRGGKRRKPRIGDTVWQKQPLVYLPDISEMVVKTQIREIDLHKVGVGKPAVVSVDAYPDLRLCGEVKTIGVMAEPRPGTQKSDKYFQVVVAVKEGDQRLRPGMTSRVEIECAKVEDALCVPVQAAFTEQGKSYCYVDIKASYEKREVSIGAQSENWAQVLDGLNEGEHVALSRPPADEIKGEQ